MIIASLAVQQPYLFQTWFDRHGNQSILMLDVKSYNYLLDGNQSSQVSIFEYLDVVQDNLKYISIHGYYSKQNTCKILF